MPFSEMNVKKEIERRKNADSEFKKSWDDSRMEYDLLGQFMKLRKEQGFSQADIAEFLGSTQQVISRIEKHEQSPTLKTLCNWANVLNVDIQLVPRQM
ncbi:MAG: helix-turn-helix domain-containing protein [Eubacterium sp.]|jgi:DNA-binding XRE family transcriptional regulator|nr:helix-turn-helix domain-containing protein [Eubacterium sp.]